MKKYNLSKAAKIIRNGGLVAFPTETVYGLGANALDPVAVAKIFEAKKRPFFDPLIVHISNSHQLKELTQDISPLAQKLIKHFWPGPLTIIFKKSKIIPYLITSGLDTVAIRIPDHPIALELIQKSQCPIAAPSANPFGRLSPTQAKHVRKHLGNSVDLIINGGKCKNGLESTIIDSTSNPPTILRSGALSIEDIKKVIKNVRIDRSQKTKLSPGNLPTHYAPVTKLILLNHDEPFPAPKTGMGYLVIGPLEPMLKRWKHVRILSASGNLKEAAANLFDSLHQLDELKLKTIYVKPLSTDGIGATIMDRLIKAANTFKLDPKNKRYIAKNNL